MLTFFNTYGRNIRSSQNMEDGILQECIARIPDLNKSCCEIGGHNGEYCSNTSLLIHEYGWKGKFVEADFDLWTACAENYKHIKDRVRSVCSLVSPENINAFVEDDVSIVSLDIDGNDLACFRAMKAKPAIVIIEVNSGFPAEIEHESEKQGCSYLTAAKVAIEKGYFVLCHTGNLILVDKQYRKLFPEIKGDGIKNADLYFRTQWLKQTA